MVSFFFYFNTGTIIVTYDVFIVFQSDVIGKKKVCIVNGIFIYYYVNNINVGT